MEEFTSKHPMLVTAGFILISILIFAIPIENSDKFLYLANDIIENIYWPAEVLGITIMYIATMCTFILSDLILPPLYKSSTQEVNKCKQIK